MIGLWLSLGSNILSKKQGRFFVCVLASLLFWHGEIFAQETKPATTHQTQKKKINVPQRPTTTPKTVVKPKSTPQKTTTLTPKTKKDTSLHAKVKHSAPVKKVTPVKKALDTASILGASSTTHNQGVKPSNSNKLNAKPTTAQVNNVHHTSNVKKPFVRKRDALWEKTMTVPYLPLKAKGIYVMDEEHPHESKDLLFYIVCGLFLLFGIVRSAFPKYSDSLFQNLLSFSISNKSDSSLGQNNLPSLLLNILFCISVGLITTLLLLQNQQPNEAFWRIWLLVSGALGVIYLVKYLTIFLSGWVFNASDDASVYTYVVFTVNKVIGILCLPAILILAFANQPQWNHSIITIGSILLIGLLLYRYIVTFSVIARNLQLNAFHFFLYLCSVEIIPILILYKLFFKDLAHWI